MNLRDYFNKIREFAEAAGPEDVIVCSLKTNDGGREGVFTEVAPRLAGQLIEDKRARLATEEETLAYRQKQAEAIRRVEEERAAQRIQVQLLTTKPQVRKR